MSKSSFKFKANKPNNSFPGFKMLKHQVRMEIVAKNGMKKLDVGHILHDLMQRANNNDKVEFFDIHGNPFDTTNFPEDQEFIDRLGAETVETGKSIKVTMGFYMVSTSTLQRIKKAVGFSWLNQQQIFIRTQRMPFTEGTDMYLMGYMTMEHTTVSNPMEIERSVSDKWYSYMDKMAAEHEMNSDDEEFLHNIQLLEEAEIIVNDELKIPISAERTIIRVDCQGKKSFETPVFQIFVPRRYQEAAKYLNDRALLETQTLKNMIPFSVSKTDHENFYRQMVMHAQFLHEHRCIKISNVPPSEFSTTLPSNSTEETNKTLHHALLNNKMIDRVHEHAERTTIIVAINARNRSSVEAWLDEILPKYPYEPTRIKGTENTSTDGNSTRTGKYSKLFGPKDNDSTAESSFDPSTITTNISRTRNPWNNGPPMNVSFNRRQRNKVSLNIESEENGDNHTAIHDGDHNNGMTLGNHDYLDQYDSQSRNSGKSHIESIQSEVSVMVEKALAAERKAIEAKFLALEKQQKEFNEKVSEWDKKMTAMKKEIVDSTVQGTVTLLTGTMTPFATKEDNIKLQEQTNTVIHQAVNTTNNEIASLKEGISALLQRTNHLFATIHNPDETSPPRKTRLLTELHEEHEEQSEKTNPVKLFHAADTDMTTAGAGED